MGKNIYFLDTNFQEELLDGLRRKLRRYLIVSVFLFAVLSLSVTMLLAEYDNLKVFPLVAAVVMMALTPVQFLVPHIKAHKQLLTSVEISETELKISTLGFPGFKVWYCSSREYLYSFSSTIQILRRPTADATYYGYLQNLGGTIAQLRISTSSGDEIYYLAVDNIPEGNEMLRKLSSYTEDSNNRTN